MYACPFVQVGPGEGSDGLKRNRARRRRPRSPNWDSSSTCDGAAVSDPIDCAVEVIGNQHRPIFDELYVGRAPNIVVVLDEASDERLDRLHCTVFAEVGHNNIPADLLSSIPGAVTRDEDRVAILRREHIPGVEPHPERGRMRAQQCDRLGELVARVTPPEFLIRNVALVAIRVAEVVLAGLGEPIELVFRDVFRQPVAAVFREIELLGDRAEVHSDDLADAPRHDFRAAAVEVDAADLCMGRRGHTDVARRADLEIELVVRPDGEELPAMGLIFRQIVVDDDRLWRVVEVVLDLFDLRNSGELRDVQYAVLEGEAVWPIQPRVDRLDLALFAPVDDGIDLVEQAAADEHRALVPLPQRARIAYARRIELDLEALRRLQLLDRQLVGGGRNWRRYDWRKRDPQSPLQAVLEPRAERRQVQLGRLPRGQRVEAPAAAQLQAKRRRSRQWFRRAAV